MAETVLDDLAIDFAQARHRAEFELAAAVCASPLRSLEAAQANEVTHAMIHDDAYCLIIASAEVLQERRRLAGEIQDCVLLYRLCANVMQQSLSVRWTTEPVGRTLAYATRGDGDGAEWSQEVLAAMFDLWTLQGAARGADLWSRRLGEMYRRARDSRAYVKRAATLLDVSADQWVRMEI